MAKNPLRVVAAIIRKGDEILIARRYAGDGPEGGKWEFPGGKIEPGERPEDALVREINEELGIVVKAGEPYATIPHTNILLMVFLADYVSGKVENKGCQDSKWVRKDELAGFVFAAPDLPVVKKLTGSHQH
jgi:8-oxo-dGTP diphosphatase